MNKPNLVTFTGVDQFTDLAALQKLQRPDQPIEFGFLYSCDRQGREARYPAFDWLAGALEQIYAECGDNLSLALHVCGARATEQLWGDDLTRLTNYVDRVQINGTLPLDLVSYICERNPHSRFVTQHTGFNMELLHVPEHNHELLIDASGGRGLTPKQWRRPATGKHVGFAGGLGPHNLAMELPLIVRAVESRPYWIDMESKLRKPDPRVQLDQDVFDLNAVANVLESLAKLK